MVPATAVAATAVISRSVNRKLRVMNIPFVVCTSSIWKQLIHELQPSTAVLVWNGLNAIGNPVSGFVAITTDCDGRNWYSNDALMLAWIRNCTPGVTRLRVDLNGPLNGAPVNEGLVANPLMRSEVEFTPS